MSLPITFRPEARAKLVEAWSSYEEQRLGLRDERAAYVESAISKAARQPDTYVEVQEGVRRDLVRRSPCGAFYVVEAGARLVLALAHGRRRPHCWRDWTGRPS